MFNSMDLLPFILAILRSISDAFLAYTTKELLRTFERKRDYCKLSHVAND